MDQLRASLTLSIPFRIPVGVNDNTDRLFVNKIFQFLSGFQTAPNPQAPTQPNLILSIPFRIPAR